MGHDSFSLSVRRSYVADSAVTSLIYDGVRSFVNQSLHFSSVGSAKSNIELSQRRAAAVQQALIADGIDASRIQTQGMGEAHPVASNSTAAGRQKNRRVEVAISGQQPTASGTSAPQQ